MTASAILLLLHLGMAAGQAASPARGLISAGDYPEAAVLLGQEGSTKVTLVIGTHGRPTNCTVTESSGYIALDQATCRTLMTRARFTPARDAMGRPTGGAFDQRITWRIEGNELPAKAWALRLMVALDKNGIAGNCQIEAGGALAKRGQFTIDCASLSGAFVIPEKLAAAHRGRPTTVIFDQQFVPRVVNSINTPPDLKRYPLMSRNTVRFLVDQLGRITECTQTMSEGAYQAAEDPCAVMRGRRFEPNGRLTAPQQGTATTAIYVYAR